MAAIGPRRGVTGEREGERLRLLEANREMVRVQRAQVDLLANVSHDLRSPLTNLREFVAIVMDGLAGPVGERQIEYLGIALRNADTLAEMIEHLLVITRIQNGSFRLARKRLSLASIFDKKTLLQGVRPGSKKVRVDLRLAPSLPDLFVDPDRLLEAIRNLVDNAIKYSPDPVEICISAYGLGDDWVALAVQDDGPGIDPVTMRSLFKRFSRGKNAGRASPNGLGLGLSIVKEIVDLHGGRVEVSSEQGRGTAFTIILPICEPRTILESALTDAWGQVEETGGFAFVRARARQWDGALRPTAEQVEEQIREVMQRCLGTQDDMLPGLASGAEVCFIVAGDASGVGDQVRRLLRTVTDRLKFQLGTHVEWHSRSDWVHSSDFNGPEEMAETILRQFWSKGGQRDGE